MNWGTVFFFNSILLGVGLAMDAFSVSVVNGLAEPEMKRKKRNLIAGTFAFFQGFMPMAGWICIHTILQYFRSFKKFIPWIALILLLYIGGKMLIESLSNIRKGKQGEEVEPGMITFGALMIQGIATSIDALSVGFTISGHRWVQALVCALIIAAVTYAISMAGLFIGRKAGTRLSNKAGIVGGCILIFIGLEIFISSFL